MKSLKYVYTADFETTTDLDDCRVWAYSICNIEDYSFYYGTSIDEFFDWIVEKGKNLRLYYHNLKFDAQFLLAYLFDHQFTWIASSKEKADNTFTTLIGNMGEYYSIVVYFKVKGNRVHKVEFFDSLKIFPNFSVERIAESFNLPIRKLKIDYRKHREIGYQLTPAEIDYIRNDVEIVARALHQMFSEGHTRMTIASNAMHDYKNRIQGFRKKFPILSPEEDAGIRKSYRGGFTYVNPVWQEKDVGKGIVLDVNSLYPSRMVGRDCPLPYGKPIFYEGEYQDDTLYPLYVQTLICSFDLKPNKIPTIQIKNSRDFLPNEYITTTDGCLLELTLTSVDLKLFFEHYDVRDIVYVCGWKFKASVGYFDEYVNYWTEQKIKAGKEGNLGLKTISKLLLNSLYGRFSIGGKASQKAPYRADDGSIHYTLLKPEERELCYIPVGAFITAYGRLKTISTGQIVRDYTLKKYGEDRVFYFDTDSCHANLSDEDLEELKDVIQVDDFKLGYWAKEAEFTRARYLRQKCYIEEIDGKVNVTVAGLPKYLAPLITFENFHRGFTTKGMSIDQMKAIAKDNGASDEEIEEIHHKLSYTYVKGGVVLTDTDFTIN